MRSVLRRVKRFSEKKKRLKTDLIAVYRDIKGFPKKRKQISAVLLQSASRIIELETVTLYEIEFSKYYSCSNIFVQGVIEIVPALSIRIN